MQLSQTTQYASYEETVTVKTFTYTATVVTEAGETTATLTARQDPDRHQYREIACPKCHCFMPMRRYMGTWLPVHCTGCVVGLYDIQLAPAVVATPEPVAVEVAEPQTVASIEVSAPARDEQDALIAELAFEADAVIDREHYVAKRTQSLTSKKRYVLWHRRSDMMAIDCSCGDRRFRGRFQGRCCKHMAAHNDMLKPATQQQEAA